MSAIPLVYGQSSWLRLTKCDLTSGDVTSFTKHDFIIASKVTPLFASASSSEIKWHSTEAANGMQYSTPDNSKNFNILTGDVISESSDSTNKFECTVLASATQRSTLKVLNELDSDKLVTPVIASREIGFESDTGSPVVAGYEFILGNVSELKEEPQKGPTQFSFSIIGKSDVLFDDAVDYIDYNAVATGASNTITPYHDGTSIGPRTIPDLTSEDWTKLKTGAIVFKAAD
jgi:hypothetical protein